MCRLTQSPAEVKAIVAIVVFLNTIHPNGEVGARDSARSQAPAAGDSAARSAGGA
jgi:hypothetical protein